MMLKLKLKLQYFGHLMRTNDSLERPLMLGKIAGKRRRGWQRIRWLDSITISMDMNLGKLWEIVREMVMDTRPGMLQSVGSQSQTRLSYWTATTAPLHYVTLVGAWSQIASHLATVQTGKALSVPAVKSFSCALSSFLVEAHATQCRWAIIWTSKIFYWTEVFKHPTTCDQMTPVFEASVDSHVLSP